MPVTDLVHADSNRSLSKKSLHFWTCCTASLVEYLLFTKVYWIIFKSLKNWTWDMPIVTIFASSIAIDLLAFAFLIMGCVLPWTQRLLLEVW